MAPTQHSPKERGQGIAPAVEESHANEATDYLETAKPLYLIVLKYDLG
jgi:hypothetical protein